MSNKQFPEETPEKEKTPQPGEGSVDFSDLGPLFAPPADQEPNLSPETEEEPLQEEEISFLPEEETQEEEISFEPEAQETWEEDPQYPEDGELSFEPEFSQEDTGYEPNEEDLEEIPAEMPNLIEEYDRESLQEPQSPSVDFSDLGPLFAPEAPREPPSVQPGAAALLLKKLSELPPDDPREEPEEVSQEEPEEGLQEFPQSLNPEEEAAEETPEFIPESPEEEPEFSPEEPDEEENSEAPAESDGESSDAGEEEAAPSALTEDSSADTEEPSPASEETSEAPKAEDEKQERSGLLKRPTGKGRPKRKKGEGFFGIPNLLVTVVWIAITVLIGVTLGRMAWICAADVLAFGREDKPVTITIYEADNIDDITRKLHEGGLIKYPGLFKLYASLAVDEGEIHPGIWDLNTRYDYHALVNMMSPSSSREIVELMIPEGYSCRQIFALMEENKICTALDLGAYAASGELDDYWFLEDVPRGDMYCLEGFLFPDTYQFYKNDSPGNVLNKMLSNFNNRFDESMIAQIDTLNARLAQLMLEGGHNQAYIDEHQFSIRDVINVASRVEKETSSADEGYVIASVIYNRLFNWGDTIPYLNIDATIVYALGGKTKLTPEDLKVNSPYNTYTHTGLTPGPIANPGLSSIRAALDPSDSNYYFYVLDPALGSHRFSTTYEEHKANIASIGG